MGENRKDFISHLYKGEPMELEGQVALISGGSRGIGRGIAEAFVAEGANVVINGRSADKGAQALDEMNQQGAFIDVEADAAALDAMGGQGGGIMSSGQAGC